jgi:hypothetical protein
MNMNIEESLKFANVLSETDITTDTTTAGAIVDTKGFSGLAFLVESGTITDGTYTFKVEDGDDSGLSDAADVDLSYLSVDGLNPTALPSFDNTASDTIKKIGYVGKKRYVRLSLVSASTSTGGTNFTSKAVLGDALRQPQAQA